jgi:hypothetical protein
MQAWDWLLHYSFYSNNVTFMKLTTHFHLDHIAEGSTLHGYQYENLKSNKIQFLCLCRVRSS